MQLTLVWFVYLYAASHFFLLWTKHWTSPILYILFVSRYIEANYNISHRLWLTGVFCLSCCVIMNILELYRRPSLTISGSLYDLQASGDGFYRWHSWNYNFKHMSKKVTQMGQGISHYSSHHFSYQNCPTISNTLDKGKVLTLGITPFLSLH